MRFVEQEKKEVKTYNFTLDKDYKINDRLIGTEELKKFIKLKRMIFLLKSQLKLMILF